MLNRNIRTATGVSAVTAPASRAAAGVNHRRTVEWTSATVPTPIRAWGSNMLHELMPNTRAESAITQIDSGVLSTVIEPAASEAAKNMAFQLTDPACTAAE